MIDHTRVNEELQRVDAAAPHYGVSLTTTPHFPVIVLAIAVGRFGPIDGLAPGAMNVMEQRSCHKLPNEN